MYLRDIMRNLIVNGCGFPREKKKPLLELETSLIQRKIDITKGVVLKGR